jgi:transposase
VTDQPLPDDLASAHALIRAITKQIAAAEAQTRAALDEAESARQVVQAERAASEAAKVEAALAKAARLALEVEIEQLKFRIAKLTKDRFGASSERGAKLDQFLLALEDLQESAAEYESAADLAEAAGAASTVVRAFQRQKPAKRPLPDHLPRHRLVHPGPSACPCCGGGLRKLGEAVTESLERAPARWFVIQHVREKMSCARCEAITEAPAPFHPISRGRAGPNLLAEIVFGKYGLHLPLTRQSRAFANEGIGLDVSTMADWVGAIAASVAPLITPMVVHALSGERIHADDTPVPVLAKGKTRTGRLWVVVRDDRPFGGTDPPVAVYIYSPDRRGEHPQRFLDGYSGILQADAYSGFGQLYEPARPAGPILEAACWAHARRAFFKIAEVKKAPMAIEAVNRIDALFAIEREINGSPPEVRAAVRQDRARPLVADLEGWMRASRGKLSGKTEMAKAFDYMLKRWRSFTRFLDDGRVCLSNNAAERAIRPIAVGRRNWTFAGSDTGGHRAAAMYTLIETCRLNDSTPAPGSPTSSPGCRAIPPSGSTHSFPGTGGPLRLPPPQPPEVPASENRP